MDFAKVMGEALVAKMFLEAPVKVTVRADEVVWSDHLVANVDLRCEESMPLSKAAVGFEDGWSIRWSDSLGVKSYMHVERDTMVEVLRFRKV